MLNCNCIERLKYAWKMILWMWFQMNCIFLIKSSLWNRKDLPLPPPLFFLSANTDCLNSQDQTIVVLQSDLSGLMLYLRMKVTKQNPPFLGAVALSVKHFGWQLPKRLDHLGSRCLLEEATVVPDAKNKKIKMEFYLGETLEKLLENYCTAQAMVYLLRASTWWSAAIGPGMVPSAFSCWVCAVGSEVSERRARRQNNREKRRLVWG